MPFFSELKRRNVIRVAVAYLAAAWLLTEVASTLLPLFGVPDWGLRLIVVILAIGFVPTLIFSWVYEVTPEGLKRERDVVRDDSITRLTAKRLDATTIALILVALAVVGVDRLWLTPRVVEDANKPSFISPQDPQISETVQPKFPPNSIAVLPFLNMSDEAKNEYFSDGISEELLNLLAKLPELRVISRSSSFSFKGKGVDIPTIAAKLNVAHILEGSVRKEGNQVRITVQLIDTSSDSHLWSETYDRTLEDIFAIQDEIAKAVVEQLKYQLLPAMPEVRVADPKAFTLFLEARQFTRQHTAESLEQSIVLYKRALEIDPLYAAAWAGLAKSYHQEADNGYRSVDEAFQLGWEAANKALAIDSQYAPAYIVLGDSVAHMDPRNAAPYYQQAVELEPSGPDILGSTGSFLRALGRLDEAVTIEKYWVSRDPLNPDAYADLGYSYRLSGQWDKAITAFRTALSISPERVGSHYQIGESLLLKGEPEAALIEMNQEPNEGWRLIGLSLVYSALGQDEASNSSLTSLMREYGREAAYNIAYVLAFRGEADRAFEWLDKAVQYRDGGLASISIDVLFANLHDDERWLPFLERIGRSPRQLDAIEFAVTVPE